MIWGEKTQMNASGYTEAVEERLRAHSDSIVAGLTPLFLDERVSVLDKIRKSIAK